MIAHWRAVGGSLLLHLLVLGALILLGNSVSAPVNVKRYSFDLLAPTPPRPVVKPAPAPAPRVAKPLPPAPKPHPRPKPVLQPAAPKPLPTPAPAVQPHPEPQAVSLPLEEPPAPATQVMEEVLPVEASALPAIVEAIPEPSAEELYARQVSRYADAQLLLIRDRVSREVRYPAMARRQGWSGQVIIEFTVLLSGEVSELRVAESCGYPILDRQALRAVKAAAPFPPPPVVATLTLPVNFELN